MGCPGPASHWTGQRLPFKPWTPNCCSIMPVNVWAGVCWLLSTIASTGSATLLLLQQFRSLCRKDLLDWPMHYRFFLSKAANRLDDFFSCWAIRLSVTEALSISTIRQLLNFLRKTCGHFGRNIGAAKVVYYCWCKIYDKKVWQKTWRWIRDGCLHNLHWSSLGLDKKNIVKLQFKAFHKARKIQV